MKKNVVLIRDIILFGLIIIIFAQCSNNKRPSSEITSAKDTTTDSVPKLKGFNVYLENSGSMNGYVKGNTGFKQSIYFYLSQIENNITDSINLFYINNKVIPLGINIDSFIKNINPVNFVKKGGNTSASDIAVVLDMILNRHKTNEISLFISDCIFSPGKKYQSDKEVQNYLIQQCTHIENSFKRKLREMNHELAIVICQLYSDFNGNYFNRYDKPQYIDAKRPFYFWLIGSPKHIQKLLKEISFESFQDKGSQVENIYTIYKTNAQPNYGIVNNGKWGTFERDKKDPLHSVHSVTKAQKGPNTGKFRLPIGINYSSVLLADSYLLDSSNYELQGNNYSLTIDSYKTLHYSHILYLTTALPSIPTSRLKIVLKNRFPEWVSDKTDYIGINLKTDNAFDKTFGLEYLIKGVYDAFGGANADYATFEIKIN